MDPRARLVLFACTLVGCAAQAEVTVDVSTDLLAPGSFDRVTVVSRYGTLERAAGVDDFRSGVRLGTIRVPPGFVVFHVALLRGSTEVLYRDFEPNVRQNGLLVARLLASCRGVMCPRSGEPTAATACEGGRCVSPRCSGLEPELCPEQPACLIDSDCGGGLASCGAVRCVENLCLFVPRPGACGLAEGCDPFSGCVPLAGADAGPAGDAGAMDAPGGVCVPTDPCGDGNPCTRDGCDGGRCRSLVDDTLPFDDGDACTVGDRCVGGAGMPGAPMNCDDGVTCTSDACSAGACAHSPNDALCTVAAGGRCDLVDGCQYSTCTAATCTPATPCETAACLRGICARRAVCRPAELCCNGSCCAEDADPCTDLVCMAGGCAQIPNTASCNDGDSCTVADRCVSGVCAGTPNTCDDLDPCTDDSCGAGGCVHAPVADGTPCGDYDPVTCTRYECVTGTCRLAVCTPRYPQCCGEGRCVGIVDSC